MRIQNNITADNSHRQLGINNQNISKNAEKLSSGFRVNRAADDAAGLAISEKMRTQIRGLNRASLNIQDGVSLLQVGDGALQFIHNKLQRLRELTVQAANDTNQLLDRDAIQLEFGHLSSEVNQVVQMTNFNGKLLFDGKEIGAPYEYELGKISTPYTTTILATNYTPSTIDGWSTPEEFFNRPTAANVGTPSGPPVPNTGKFAMQIITPADGTLNVVLDFGAINNIKGVPVAPGAMTWSNFLDYFVQEFNNLGVGHVVDNIRFDTLSSTIVFDFPRDSSTNLTGIMGKSPTIEPIPTANLPRVHVGIGGNTAQANALNGTSSAGINGFPGPFRANYIMPPDGPPLHQISDFMSNNDTIIGSSPIPPPGTVERATLPGGVFPSMNVNVDGNDFKIPLVPGNYPDAKTFADAHKSVFESARFDLDVDANGNLVITTKGLNPTPSITFKTNPDELLADLGFSPTPTSKTERLLKGLVIQSGANEGDIVLIGMPRLCSRSLGISIRRPDDEGTDVDHINRLGANGYRLEANVDGDPMEYSLDVTSHDKASAALTVLTNAINIISVERAQIGSQQNRLEYAMRNVDNTSENLQAAESRIRDTDMAAEMTTFVQNQILIQASTAMLAQANTLPQGVLQLLG